jgi:signal transduction histidine kinase
MKPFASLRSRLLIAAIFWMMALFIVAGVTLTTAMYYHSNVPITFHVVFSHARPWLFAAIILLAWGIWQVRSGFSPIDQLRSRLTAVRTGKARRIDGAYPTEVQPLVEDLNTLLDHRDQAVARAVAKAGDLAHGLKTPLAILAQEADRAIAAGHDELAHGITQQVDRMRRQIDYHLAHARAAASGASTGMRSSVAESAEGLARTLQRLYADRGIVIDLRIATDHSVRTGREDLDEMLGNLLDNACKWTRSQVVVSSASNDGHVVISVDDDGRGVAAEMRDQVLRRGVRADEASPGTGFGLSIVRDLAELYGGSITLDSAPLGGLRARLQLPSSEVPRN